MIIYRGYTIAIVVGSFNIYAPEDGVCLDTTETLSEAKATVDRWLDAR